MTSVSSTFEITGSLPGIVAAEARRDPGRTVFTALDHRGEPAAALTAGELDAAAGSLAATLRSHAAPGARVLVPAMPGLRFQVAFLACLYAGMAAVPVPALSAPSAGGARTRRLNRLEAICRKIDPAIAVAPADRIDKLLARGWVDDDQLAKIRLVSTDPSSTAVPASAPETAEDGELAFLQFTSGSTSAPRGVMITHGALTANQALLCEHMGITEATTIVTWLPTYHDMGLSLGLLLPLYARAAAVVMDPATFVTHPQRWLQAMSGLPDVMSAAPDFAYAWCAKKVSEADKAGLDLSGWRVGVDGAEPVRAQTLRAFQDAFAGCGLDERTLTPAYGLAESTLFVNGGSGETAAVTRLYDRQALNDGKAAPACDGPGTLGQVELTGLGRPGPGVRVEIVDPQTRRGCPERSIGEIWVHSPSNGVGYWGDPDDSLQTFGATFADGRGVRWLRTGDLGFVDDGELFVTGRSKDLIVIHGANYYPQDFEQLARQSHPLLEGELAAAFADEDAHRVTVVVEADRHTPAEAALEAARAAVRAVTAELPVTTDLVVVPRNQLPRTTSGKSQRREAAARLRDGRFSILAQWPRSFG
ncbi:MAG: fatty acyl-AMP ligase [Stackebrandtia sp.]